MIVRKIALNGWRNYAFATAEFSPGTNVITGENAQGKTNLLEAVYLLTGGKSFRTRFDRELIGFGYTSAEVLADVYAFGREQTVRVVLRQGQRKQIWQNGVKKTAAELAGNFAAVLFCPDDLNIIRDGPAARRRMMDMAISQLRPKYGALLAEYSRLYDQKSAILRDWHEKPSLLDTLDDFSDQMCRVSATLLRCRAAYASRLNAAAAPIHADFSGGRDKLALAYRTVSTVTDALGTEKEIYYALCDHQEQHRRAELDSGQCLTGAHKDDLLIDINGQPARAFASQGQTRTAALSLKLAEREIFHDEFDEYPVLMLDDVLSGFEEARANFTGDDEAACGLDAAAARHLILMVDLIRNPIARRYCFEDARERGGEAIARALAGSQLTDAECVVCRALLGETYDAYTGYRDTLVLNGVIMKNEENLLAVGGQAQHINQLNSDIEEFYHSISYRTGRAVTAPARAAANLAKRVLHAARRG